MTRRPLGCLPLVLLACTAAPEVLTELPDATTSQPDRSAPNDLVAPADTPTEDRVDAQVSTDVPRVDVADVPSAPDASAEDRAVPNDLPTDAVTLPDVVTAPDVVTLPDVLRCADPTPLAPVGSTAEAALPTVGAATTRTVSSGGHTDVYLSGPGGVAEIAVRLDWGGTVVFWGQQGIAGSNTIDANDTGRELQLALYDPTRQFQGCAHDASCAGGNPCGNSITFLGWNPVQGGDECNRGARATSLGVTNGALGVEVTPLHWNPDWQAADCRQTACAGSGLPVGVRYRLDFRYVHANVVEVAMTVASMETIDHPLTEQEFPTLYVGNGRASTDLPLLLDADGNAVNVDQPANDGFLYRNFTSGGWVTWQHAVRDYGVGLAMDHRIATWQGWRGDGARAPYFHNVRARQSFGLAAGGTVRGRAYLALGSFDTVRGLFTDLLSRRPPFGVADSARADLREVLPGGRRRFYGWALDDGALDAVTVRVDGAQVATIPRATSRPDVCAVYPNYPGCPAAGYDGAVDLPRGDGCWRRAELVARDRDGNETTLERFHYRVP